MGLKKFFKKVGNVAKKVLPYAAAALPFIPGVGAAASTLAGSIGGLFSAKSAPPPPDPPSGGFQADPGAANMAEWEQNSPRSYTTSAPFTSPGVSVLGQRGFDWAGLAQSVAPVAAGALNFYGQRATNSANAQMAQNQMDFQAQMANTSYQRGTADMKAAGLNPMLAYSQGGAASPGGASAVMGNEVGQGASSALSAYSLMQEMQLRSEQIEQAKAQTNNIDVDSVLKAANTKNADMDWVLKDIQSRYAEDQYRTQIRLGNSAARLNELKEPREQAVGKAANMVSGGLDAINNAKDWAATGLSDLVRSAEDSVRDWANSSHKYKTRKKGN